jgi:hypothetical protein
LAANGCRRAAVVSIAGRWARRRYRCPPSGIEKPAAFEGRCRRFRMRARWTGSALKRYWAARAAASLCASKKSGIRPATANKRGGILHYNSRHHLLTRRSLMSASALPRIRVSDNRRFLVTDGGAPFFWLADTAWELFHRLTREEAELFLDNRRRKGFNVIKAVALAEFDGLHTPNAYGHTPLLDDDPTRPNEPYWQLVDDVIAMAAERGLYIGLLPTWGDKVVPMWGTGPVVFDEQNAYTYGQWLGARYRDRSNILWVLGGDRPAIADNFDVRGLWRAMAAGLDEGAGRRDFKTYHPRGGASSSEWVHDEEWLDMNMMQSGHGSGRDTAVWDMIARDYALAPAKPTLDGEPNYEDHPVNPWPKWDPANGYFRDHDVRKQSYRSVFAGGCGVTYGHHAVWQFCGTRYAPINHADRPWTEAIDRPAAGQVHFLRRLMESRPYLSRIPDQSLLAAGPGAGAHHVQATRDAEGCYAMVYLPLAEPVEIRLDDLRGPALRAWWYDPRDGTATAAGEVAAQGTHTFTPPADGPDWVLVLDDAAAGFGAPGAV